MLAMLGMYVQALVTGKGPVSNWLEHLADPSSANGFAFATKFAPTLLARLVAAGLRILLRPPADALRRPVAASCRSYPPSNGRCPDSQLRMPVGSSRGARPTEGLGSETESVRIPGTAAPRRSELL